MPFVFGVKADGDNFTDRKEETEILRQNFTHGINTIIVSPRRMGKTSLVGKVADLVGSHEIRIARMDAFPCRSETDFANAFVTAVIKATSSKFEEWVANARAFVSHLVPKLSFGPDPTNEFSISIDYKDFPNGLDEMLSLPEKIASKCGYRIVVCIDEFQQVGEMSDSLTFQKRLRTVWQHQKNVTYCLYGSKKHMMEKIFQNVSCPFYRFGDLIYLKKISRADWVDYICGRFRVTGKNITEELAGMICDMTECYSSYVQQLAWFLWLRTEKEACREDLEVSVNRLLDANESLFIQMTESLSEYQMNFLRALTEGVTNGFSTQKILNGYRLGTSANINRLKKSLMEKDLIDVPRANCIQMADPILKLWLRRRVFGKPL